MIRFPVCLVALATTVLSAQPSKAQDAATILKGILGPPSTGSVAAPSAPTLPTTTPPADVTSTEASDGLKLALGKASDAVVSQLGAPGGFANDPAVRIGLPGPLAKADGVMRMLGKAGIGADVAGKLNAAAEGAVSKALPLLKSAISRMTLTDALGILGGGPTSATDYFRRTTATDLQAQMRPLVSQSLEKVKAFAAVEGAMGKAKLPASLLKAPDLTGYVTQKAGDGVFYYLGEQEKKIRANPLATGSSLLAKIFGIR